MNDEERKICLQYGTKDATGNIHCAECPLVIDKEQRICKANVRHFIQENERTIAKLKERIEYLQSFED